MRLLAAALLASLCLILAASASAQSPGAFLGPPCFAVSEQREGPSEAFPDEHHGPIPLGCPVIGGYVVMLDVADAVHPQQDPHNWSDVIAFTTGGPVQPGQPTDALFFISDSVDPTTGIENGISPADLAFAGLSVADIVGNPTTVYVLEGFSTVAGAPDANIYDAVGPTPVVAHYIFRSDPPENPTPTQKNTWGRLKMMYR
jgi:hypothetical protein